jgi:predicted O-methyltransferase YrrM
MNYLKNRIKNILWKYWMYRGMQSLKYQGIADDPEYAELDSVSGRNDGGLANKIRQAISETVFNRINLEEKIRISRIEQVRKQFTGNPTPVTILDFGAGNPNSNRSDEEMAKGTTSTTTYGDICTGSKPALWALLLFKLIRKIQPELAIELGTCIGISAAYQSSAMHLNGKGRLITIEGSETIAVIAKKNIESLHLSNVEILCGTFKEVLPEVFVKTPSIDFAFIDGHHDEQATIAYFELLLPHLSTGALVVFDDISWSSGMRRAWEKICKHPAVTFAIDLKVLGICGMR